ncbi:E3 ubiquitin-protein ligase DTX3L-like isoform X3 [Hemibagrus wyckioides]|uniref:E3 ubiquitin-protein ligase DTX3L-like isoform X3 n=1 Tax=Hemibagrus wyckioides TaxID=337641 RepID=UPI00266B7324|nr:E3 ubiquitin-protein ligase DTX3L-like isoform X3 [Hemibagrus wyckioides]
MADEDMECSDLTQNPANPLRPQDQDKSIQTDTTTNTQEPEEMDTSSSSPSSSGNDAHFFKSSSDVPAQSSDQTPPEQTQNHEDLYRAGPGGSDPEVLAAAQQDLYRAGPGGSDPEVLAAAQDIHRDQTSLSAASDTSQALNGSDQEAQNFAAAAAADDVKETSSSATKSSVTTRNKPPDDEEKALNGSDQEAQNFAAAADVKETSSSVIKSSVTTRNKPPDDEKKNKYQTSLSAASGTSQDTADKNEFLTSPSAPQDVSLVHVKVDWPGELPEKWRFYLQTALQSWCNSEKTVNCTVNVVQLLDDGRTAEVEVTPSTALIDIETATLMFKKVNREAKVYFQKAEPQPGNKSFTLKENKKVTSESDAGTIHISNTMDVGAASIVPGHDVMSRASGALTVPPFLYCYLIQAYKKEVEKIENVFGVKIKAETCISFSTEKTDEKNGSDSVRRATEAFTDLYQAKANNLKPVSIPQIHMESEIMKEVLRNIPHEERKITLNMSANNHLLFGPENITSMVERHLNPDRGDEEATSFNHSKSHNMETSSNWISTQNTFQSLDMDIKDTPTVIEMDEAHWQLMEAACKEQIRKIQNKYGVEFHAEPVQGSMKVLALSVGTHQVNLQAHALSALTRLYQKVVTSAATCDLKDASYTETSTLVSQVFERIRSQHNCVGGGERNGSWKLFGLPKHLVPTIADIEKTIGQPVFDEKKKKMLGYPWKFPQASGFERDQMEMDVMRGAHGTDLRAGRENPDFTQKFPNKAIKNDKAEENEDKCSICLDTFTEKTKLACGHEFCKECLKLSIKSSGEICPLCKKIFGKLKGNQPDGQMQVKFKDTDLPGFKHCGTIEIYYIIPDGHQTSDHPNPGTRYHGTHRTAYLPNNTEGKNVLTLLQRAFDQKLIFTVGISRTTGADNVVIWNDIHHKTNIHGGPQGYGYPDPNYLKRVKEELKAKGIE